MIKFLDLTIHPQGVYILIRFPLNTSMRKNTLTQRLNIVKGQIDGLSKLVDDKNSCKKVITQFHAVNSGLKKIMEIYLKDNLASCFQTINSEEKKNIDFILEEIIKIK